MAKKQAILETRRVVAELIAEINCLGSSIAVVDGITPATSAPKRHYIGAAGHKTTICPTEKTSGSLTKEEFIRL